MPRPLVLALVALLLAGCSGDDEGSATTTAAATADLAVLDRVELPARPGGIAGADGAVWATNPERGELVRVDAEGGEVDATYKVAQAVTGVTAGAGFVWVVDPLESAVVRVDAGSGEPTGRTPLANPSELAFGFDSVWAVEGAGVTRIDAQTGKVRARIALPGPVQSLAVGPDAIWASGRFEFDIARIDPETNRLAAQIDLGEFVSANALASAGGATWASAGSPEQSGLARIDARTNEVLGLLPISRRRFPVLGRVAAEDGAVWFVSAVDVGRVDPRTNTLLGSVNASTFKRRTPASPRYADLGQAVLVDGDLWVADPTGPAVVRVGPAS